MQEQLTTAVTDLMKEAFEGAQHDWTWIVDNEPDHGILGTMASVSAERASQSPSEGKPSMAAHAGHLLFGLQLANALAAGEEPDVDWEDSWSMQTVTDEQWVELQQNLRAEYQQLLKSVPIIENADQETLTGTIATVAHVTYHLGAMRQLAG